MIGLNPYSFYYKPLQGCRNVKSSSTLPFSSTPLYNLNVNEIQADGTYKLIPATFTQLDPKDPNDKAAILNLADPWKNARFYKTIKNNFKKPHLNIYYYAVELNENNQAYTKQTKIKPQKILSLALVYPNSDKSLFEIKFIQADPEILYDEFYNPEQPIKGAGELSIYGILRQAQEKYGKDGIYLHSDNDGFYFNLGMDYYRHKKNALWFTPGRDKKFIEETNKKYNLNNLPEIKDKGNYSCKTSKIYPVRW